MGAFALRRLGDRLLSPTARVFGVRVASPCKGQTLAKAVMPERRLISGKLGTALALALHCRKSVDVSELAGKATACLPHPLPPNRLIDTNGNASVEWPGDRFSPARDRGRI